MSCVAVILILLLLLLLIIVALNSSDAEQKNKEKHATGGDFEGGIKGGLIYSVFGAGPSGLYTVWRLMNSGKVTPNDTVNLYEWGNYQFGDNEGTRAPAGRICTYHYNKDPTNSYIEIGGMRYIHWDGSYNGAGHRLMTQTISELGLDDQAVDFLTTDNPLYYLRGYHFYAKDIQDGKVRAPYNTSENNKLPYDVYGDVSKDILGNNNLNTPAKQCQYYANGIFGNTLNSEVYGSTDVVGNVGYWNIFYDQVGNEAYNYANDGGGYDSNLINWNAANASIYNSEFATGGTFKTIKGGFSRIFSTMYNSIVKIARDKGLRFNFHPGTRLHSIWIEGDTTMFRLATAENPNQAGPVMTSDVVFMAMPRNSIELVAQATKYSDPVKGREYFLNSMDTTNLIESVIKQPSNKIAMFFDRPWWTDRSIPFKPDLVNQGQTDNVYGPSITDLPIRQVYYFGDNASEKQGVYGILAAYNDIINVDFFNTLEIGDKRRRYPQSESLQPLEGGVEASEELEKMVLKQLAELHYGPGANLNKIPKPLETVYTDWSLNPFGAGYHAWKANYNISEVMNQIRTPAGPDKKIYIVGSAYSNEQAWIEGAFCVAESVLVEYLGLDPLISALDYPLIC